MPTRRQEELVDVDILGQNGEKIAAMWNERLTECAECGEEIGFALLIERNKWVPIDPPASYGEAAECHKKTCDGLRVTKRWTPRNRKKTASA